MPSDLSPDPHATRLHNTPPPSPPPAYSEPSTNNGAVAARGRPIAAIDLRDAWNDVWIEPWRVWALCAATVVFFAVGVGVGWYFWKGK